LEENAGNTMFVGWVIFYRLWMEEYSEMLHNKAGKSHRKNVIDTLLQWG
jgi:hypothetical protein